MAVDETLLENVRTSHGTIAILASFHGNNGFHKYFFLNMWIQYRTVWHNIKKKEKFSFKIKLGR